MFETVDVPLKTVTSLPTNAPLALYRLALVLNGVVVPCAYAIKNPPSANVVTVGLLAWVVTAVAEEIAAPVVGLMISKLISPAVTL